MTIKNSNRILEEEIRQLKGIVLQQQKMQEALKTILTATANKRGEQFFRILVRSIADILQVKYAFVAELENEQTARTLALWTGASHAENVSYSLHGTPCNNVTERGFCIYPDNIRQQFPEDHMLEEMGAECYIGTPLRDSQGTPLGILAVLDDKPFVQIEFAQYLLSVFALQAASEISNMRIESELRKSRDEWESSFNAIDDMVTIQDSNLNILRANRAAALYAGKPAESIFGQPCYKVFQDRDEVCENCPELKTLEDKLHHTSIVAHKNTDRVFLVSTSPVLDRQGNLTNIVHVAKDITLLKQLEEEVYQSRKMESIGTLASGIAHDFNNILTSVMGYSELLRDDIIKGRADTDKIDKIIQGGQRARDLVNQILTFSRKGLHKTLSLKPHLIVGETMKLLRATLPTTIEISQDIDRDCGMINADPTKFQQVMMNLCTNAMHAMENERGVIRVTLRKKEITSGDIGDRKVRPGTFIELAVADTGCGIDEANMQRIFEPYFTTKAMGRGTGLGLSLVHGIVCDHQGFIEVESNPGGGSVFRVYFPAVVHRKFLPPVKETAVPLPTGSERILLVDDEATIVEVHRLCLERLGYAVTVFSDSREALRNFRADPDKFDLIITDQTMPGLTGAELAGEIKKIRKDIPVILCSGYSSVISDEKAKEIGICKFLKKPLEMNQLALNIRESIDGLCQGAAASDIITS